MDYRRQFIKDVAPNIYIKYILEKLEEVHTFLCRSALWLIPKGQSNPNNIGRKLKNKLGLLWILPLFISDALPNNIYGRLF